MIRVDSWNIKDGLSDPDRAPMIVAALERSNPTAAVLSEAYNIHETENLNDIFEDFWKKGYDVSYVNQDVEENRADMHGLVMLTKREQTLYARPIQMVSRYAIHASLVDDVTGRDFAMIGQHGNDINEATRLADARALQPLYEHFADGQLPVIHAGDLNTADAKSTEMRVKIIRALSQVWKRLPSSPPNPENPPTGIKRKMSLLQRLSEMAIGDAYVTLLDYGLGNTDPSMLPTMDENHVKIKLDHILVSSHFNVRDFTVRQSNADERAGLYSPASDHRAISADLSIAE